MHGSKSVLRVLHSVADINGRLTTVIYRTTDCKTEQFLWYHNATTNQLVVDKQLSTQNTQVVLQALVAPPSDRMCTTGTSSATIRPYVRVRTLALSAEVTVIAAVTGSLTM